MDRLTDMYINIDRINNSNYRDHANLLNLPR